MLFHSGDGCIVDVGAMLDGIDAGFCGPQNPLSTVSMGSYFAAQAMSVGDDGLHLLLGILRCLRIIASGEHSASGANLHDVGAVFDDLSRLVLHSRNAVCGSLRAGVSLERQQVVVT